MVSLGCGNGKCMDAGGLEGPTSAFHFLGLDVNLEKSAITVSYVTVMPGLWVCSPHPIISQSVTLTKAPWSPL